MVVTETAKKATPPKSKVGLQLALTPCSETAMKQIATVRLLVPGTSAVL